MDGIGLENEQIGQTQVAVEGSAAGAGDAAYDRGGVEPLLTDAAYDIGRAARDVCLEGFGYKVTLGDDFKKPACDLISYVAYNFLYDHHT